MGQGFMIAGEIYLLGFVISLLMAVVIKVVLYAIRKTDKKSGTSEQIKDEGRDVV